MQRSITVVAMFLTERGGILLVVNWQSWHPVSMVAQDYLRYVYTGGDFDLAILATDFCGRSGLLRVCLHWVTVWVAGF